MSLGLRLGLGVSIWVTFRASFWIRVCIWVRVRVIVTGNRQWQVSDWVRARAWVRFRIRVKVIEGHSGMCVMPTRVRRW